MMMKRKYLVNREFQLSNENINDCIRQIEELPGEKFENGLNKKALLLRVEEALLSFQDHFGEDTQAGLRIRKLFGKYNLRIIVKGEYFNPLQILDEDEDAQRFAQTLSAYGSRFEYNYNSGKNQLAMSFRKKGRISSVARLFASILFGLAIGCLGMLLPEGIRNYPLEILDSIQSIIMGLISFAALPVVFLSVIEGITASGSIQNLGQKGSRTIKSFLLVSLAVTIYTFVLSCILFPLNFETGGGGESIFETIVSVITGIFPNNIVKPFEEGNMLQVILIGVIIGCAILVLQEKVEYSLSPVNKISHLFSTIMEWFCRFIPVGLACMIACNCMNGSFSEMLRSWPVYIAMIGLSFIVLLVTAIIVSRKIGRSVSDIIKAIKGPMITGLSTASTVTAFNGMKKSLVEKLNVDSKYVSFALPMGISFFAVGATLEQLLILLYVAHLAGVEVSAAWIISALLLNYVFAIAAPPVSGGSIAVMTMLMQTQGIPEMWNSIAIVSVMLLEYVSTSLRVGMMTMVIAGNAKKLEAME